MPSTYSPSLRLELIGNGEQAGTWGTTTNNNLGTLLEQAITGVQPITLTGGDYTLTDYNGLPDTSRNAVLMFNGLLSAPCNVIAPSSEKVYIVRNRANATITMKTATGNGISIANAASEVIFCDGTDFYGATQFNFIDGNLTVTGNESVGGTVTIGGDVFGNANPGQWYLPSGNTISRNNTSPVNGLVRYNTDGGGFYEGYSNGTWLRFLTTPEGNYGISYIIAGGGGGGSQGNGGGGAGGLLAGSITSVPGTLYTITLGGGGAAGTPTGGVGTGSSISGVATVVGGGSGGGGSGGSGGGGVGGSEGGPGTGGNGGAGTTFQGNAGGKGGDHVPGNLTGSGAGGGGGAGGVGGNGDPSGVGYNGNGGAGGIGYASSITGTIAYYAGGGGGGGGAGPGGQATSGGTGGNGGGGNGGGVNGTAAATSGSTNTGGGGGGGGTSTGNAGYGAAGGSGFCILSIATASYTGNVTGSPIVTTSGANTILTYTISGTYTS